MNVQYIGAIFVVSMLILTGCSENKSGKEKSSNERVVEKSIEELKQSDVKEPFALNKIEITSEQELKWPILNTEKGVK